MIYLFEVFNKCGKRRRELAALGSGSLPPDRAARAEAHLAVCPNCRAEWESLAALTARLRTEPPPPAAPPADLWTRLESQLLEPPAPVRSRKNFSPPPALALSAGGAVLASGLALAAVLTGSLTSRRPIDPSPSVPPAPVPMAVAARPAAIVELPLSIPAPAESSVAPPISLKRKSVRVAKFSRPAPPPLEQATVDPFAAKPEPPARPRRTPRKSAARPTPPIDANLMLATAPEESPAPAPIATGMPEPVISVESSVGDGRPSAESALSIAASPGASDAVKSVPEEVRSKSGSETERLARASAVSRSRRGTDAELSERRAAAAMEPPLDAVERASRSRKLFP